MEKAAAATRNNQQPDLEHVPQKGFKPQSFGVGVPNFFAEKTKWKSDCFQNPVHFEIGDPCVTVRSKRATAANHGQFSKVMTATSSPFTTDSSPPPPLSSSSRCHRLLEMVDLWHGSGMVGGLLVDAKAITTATRHSRTFLTNVKWRRLGEGFNENFKVNGVGRKLLVCG